MPVLTYAQMEGYWIKAGGAVALAPVAAAIGEAESGGNTDIVNKTDNGGRQSSYGWLQISNGTHTPPAPNWADPLENARLGVAKFQGAGNSFSPWGTYTSGAYRAYLSGSTTPDTNVSGNPNAITAETAAATAADCMLGFGGIPGSSWISDVLGGGGNLASFCLLSRSQGRAVAGAFLLIAGVAGTAVMFGVMLWLGGQQNGLNAQALQLVNRGMMRGMPEPQPGPRAPRTAAQPAPGPGP